MSTVRFLDYEVALLLAKYGKEAVLVALAKRLALSQTDLEALLNEIGTEKPAARRARKPPATDPIEIAVTNHSEKAEQLRAIGMRFQNRLFLPELRDVRRFFQQRDRELGHPKSRQQCLPKLLTLLTELDISELDALAQSREGAGYSSLALISDEIMRRNE